MRFFRYNELCKLLMKKMCTQRDDDVVLVGSSYGDSLARHDDEWEDKNKMKS